MDVELLSDIGLNNNQAKAYMALVKNGSGSAPRIATLISESRTNTYKLLDKLSSLGLTNKELLGSKVIYHPVSPVALEQMLRAQSEQVAMRERKLNAALPSMLDFFFAHSEQPSIRYFRGEDGLYEAYKDQTHSKTPLYFIRSLQGIRFFGYEKAHRLRNLFPANNVERYGIIQDIEPPKALPHDRMPVKESDKIMKLHRTWITTDDYNEPVEWVAYEDKLAIISFGEEIMGVVIQSPQIAKAFKQIYKLLSNSIIKRPDYNDLPKLGLYTRKPLSVAINQKIKETTKR